jgi:hypothetical protein
MKAHRKLGEKLLKSSQRGDQQSNLIQSLTDAKNAISFRFRFDRV